MARSTSVIVFIAIFSICLNVKGQTVVNQSSKLKPARATVVTLNPVQIRTLPSSDRLTISSRRVQTLPVARTAAKPSAPILVPANSSVYSFQRDGIPSLEQRRQLRAMPIEQRPYRPFHFYGNTVRRRMRR
ncbi:MAG: hypothetical protein AAFN77_12935 [Planctomycetota bacterium]